MSIRLSDGRRHAVTVVETREQTHSAVPQDSQHVATGEGISRRSFVAASMSAAPLAYVRPKLTKLGEPNTTGFGFSGPEEPTATPTQPTGSDDEPTPTPTPTRPVSSGGDEPTPTPTPDNPGNPGEPGDHNPHVGHVGNEVVKVLPATGIGSSR
jgi:hypothetical protein